MKHHVNFLCETETDHSKALNEMDLDTGKAKILVACEWPEGTEEDYGYFALKDAMAKAYASIGGGPNDLAWFYDPATTREGSFSADAHAETDVDVDIDIYDDD